MNNKIVEAHKPNFKTLQQAFKDGQVGLVECYDTRLGEVVAVLCAFNKEFVDGKEEVLFVPFATLLNGDPYSILQPPKPEGGFYTGE